MLPYKTCICTYDLDRNIFVKEMYKCRKATFLCERTVTSGTAKVLHALYKFFDLKKNRVPQLNLNQIFFRVKSSSII